MSNHTERPEAMYHQMVKDTLAQVDDQFLAEDIDLLCQYIVLRFLRTSSLVVAGTDKEDIGVALAKFLEDRFSFIMAFVTVLNSDPSMVKTEA